MNSGWCSWHCMHVAALRARIIDPVRNGGHGRRVLQILRDQLVANVSGQPPQKQG
jgi:hypothetical protein